jgi:predicted nucleic acid-binding protein
LTLFVLDASTTLSWHFQDEVTERTRAIARSAYGGGVAVPQHWFLEVASALLRGERRERTSGAATSAFLGRLQELDAEVHALSAHEVFTAVIPLARSHRLSVYDAAYLELAHRLALPLATRDGRLRAAALILNIDVIGEEA